MPWSVPPPRPSPVEEKMASRLFLALAPRVPLASQPEVPRALGPAEDVAIPRRRGRGTLSATWYPAPGAPRGGVLLVPPWVMWGRAYFHRRGRIKALRQAGYHALAVDLPGFGGSGPAAGLLDRDVEDALIFLQQRLDGLPLHLWGVSAGGYWAHPVLSRSAAVAGAFFEDVSPHLLEWSWRMAPLGRPGYLVFRHCLPRAYRYLDMRSHAAARGSAAPAYVSGARDPGVRPEDTRALARAAGAPCRVVPEAGHLEAIKRAGPQVVELALETFRRAEEARGGLRREEAPAGKTHASLRARHASTPARASVTASPAGP